MTMVSICGCHSTELDMQPQKTNELEMKMIEAIPEVAPPQNPCPISQFPVGRQAQNNFPTPSQVESKIKKIQQKAFEFAVATARGVGNRKERHDRSIVMDRRLTELYPLIPCVESKQALVITWSNARLDIGYVLSDGKDLARPGLYVYVQTLRKENQEKKDN